VIQAETEELRASRTALCSITAGTCCVAAVCTCTVCMFYIRLYAVWAHVKMICLCYTLHTDVLKLSLDLLGIETVEEL
jgi:hypothetical protein